MIILEALGVIAAIAATFIRSFLPRYVISSFILAAIASVLLFVYTLATQQHWLVLLNLVSLIMAIGGMIRWWNVKVEG